MFKSMFLLIFYIILIPNAWCKGLGPESCTSECTKAIAISTNDLARGDSCARGCRFFDIAQLMFSGNASREACLSYCEESYRSPSFELTSCKTGCRSAVPRPPVVVPVVAEVSWSVLVRSEIPRPCEDDLSREIPELSDDTPPKRDSWCGSIGNSEQAPVVTHCLLGSLLLVLVALGLLLGLLLDDQPSRRPPPYRHPPTPPPLYTAIDNTPDDTALLVLIDDDTKEVEKTGVIA